MTHGDKAKAKAGKKSQASAKARGSKSGENGKGSSAKAGAKSGKAEAGKKGGAQKSRGATGKAVAPKDRASEAGAHAKGRGDATAFGDPRIATAFKHAVKKYPNAFRKLTD